MFNEWCDATGLLLNLLAFTVVNKINENYPDRKMPEKN